MNFKNLQVDLAAHFGDARIKTAEPLAKHCNWRVGGPADLFLIARSADELVKALQVSLSHHHKPTILGFGANVLVSDKGIRGLVILNRAHRISFLPDSIVEADSGTNLAILAKESAKHKVGGLEFLIGIPGTVGAAVAVNAGTREQWMSTLVDKVLVLTNEGHRKWFEPEELEFSYRNSKLKRTGEVVITAKLKGRPDKRENIEENLLKELQVRKSQPTGPSAGSVFKNPPSDYAGRLIEACGLKGFQIGGAKISEMHANFIINFDTAKAEDIRQIIDKAKNEVQSRFRIELEEEIRYLGEW